MRRVFVLAAAAAFMTTACSDDSVNSPRLSSAFKTVQHNQINGTPDTSFAHKAVVALRIHGSRDYADQTICTGTLVTDQYVVTAAHCVAELGEDLSYDKYTNQCVWEASLPLIGPSDSNANLKIGIGNNDQAFTKSTSLYDIEKIYYHPNYTTILKSTGCEGYYYQTYKEYSGTINDIAVIKLKNRVPANVAKPIPVLPPWLGITNAQAQSGLKTEFVGFGYNEKGTIGTKLTFTGPLKYYCGSPSASSHCYPGFTVHVEGCHPNAELCAKYGGYQSYDDKYVMVPYGSFFYLQTQGGPCQGDSGGPSFVTVGGKEYLASVTSYGDSTCQGYGVSTAVQSFYDWIVQKAPAVANSYTEICDNGVDDDGDGKIDTADSDCKAPDPVCGDGIVNLSTEECDLFAMRDNISDCAKLNPQYESGKVTCNANCTRNYANCVVKPVCGNGKIETGEECDGSLFPSNKSKCSDIFRSYNAGTLACTSDCKIDSSDCRVSIKPSNPDGEDKPGNQTSDQPGTPGSGEQGGSADPGDSTTSICGNGILEANEECDTVIFPNYDINCSTYAGSNASGYVSCNANCTINTGACTIEGNSTCGNGILEGAEICDGTAFQNNKTSCSDWNDGYSDGLVNCNANCTLNYSGCSIEGAAPNPSGKNGASSCSTTPLRSSSAPAALFACFGLLGLAALRRRKSNN